MRKIDEIKGLRNQLEELNRQKVKLIREKETLIKANREMQAAVDAIMITIAKQCGKKGADAEVYELSFPKVDVMENLGRYDIETGVQGDERRILVRRKKEDDDGTVSEGP